MVFDLTEQSDKSDEYIFGKPKYLSGINKNSKKRKRRARQTEDKNETNKEIRSRKVSNTNEKEQDK